LISVFTPLSLSGNAHIKAAFETLKAQSYTDWEWVVLENHGGKLPKKIRSHPQVRVFGDATLEGIGALKRRCCELSRGSILFEFDHDDLLHPDALKETVKALKKADFCVSDFAEFQDGSWSPNTYRVDCGWTSYPVTFQGHDLLAQPNPSITPQNLRLVDWAPNHLRAWRKKAYWRIGGHNADFPVADDHELVVRGYLMGLRYAHIKKCLYFYRVHAAQTVKQDNGRIRDLTHKVYNQYIFQLAEKFATDQQLELVDLCGGIDAPPGYLPLDKTLGHDLDEAWPLRDSSVGILRAYDAIEHLRDPIHTMNEAYRVLAPGGFFMIQVPSTDGRGAFQDPTHVSFWNPNSFWYYTNASYARYLPAFKGRFQVSRIIQFYPTPFHEKHRIPYVEVHLIALKPGYEPMGLVEI
jgi:SAM-dependent methyltransferase